MRGRWAAGIEPRGFTWVFRDQLAVSERPGGSTLVHRKVRRDEELMWLRHHGFNRVISILPDMQSLAAYTEHGMTAAHYALRGGPRQNDTLTLCYQDLDRCLETQTTTLLHSDEVSDRLLGLLAGYLMWSGRAATAPTAIAAVERLFHRSLGPDGRTMISDVPVKPS